MAIPHHKDLDFDKLNNLQVYSQWAIFRIIPGALDADRELAIQQTQKFFADLDQGGKVTVRGIYDVSSIRAEADIMIWWLAEDFRDIQFAYNAFRRETLLGQATEAFWVGTGVHRPSEFNKQHLPAFVMGVEPADWITVYPFVRSYDWYTMDPAERGKILREHGETARPFPDVLANTVSAFALGDYEWLLAFEADDLGRIVDLMHQMRYTEARHHVRVEIPFFTGRRVEDLKEIIDVLP